MTKERIVHKARFNLHDDIITICGKTAMNTLKTHDDKKVTCPHCLKLSLTYLKK